MRLSNRWLVGAALASAVGASPARSPAGPDDREPPLLLGGASPPHLEPIPIDPWLPTGSLRRDDLTRPSAAEDRPGCSARLPVCVHAAGATDDVARAALAALERAYERLVRVLELPAPLPDRGLGGSDALDWYLGAPESRLATGRDAPELGFWDAAPAFCIGGAVQEDVERAATRCVGEAIAFRLDAAESAETRAAYGTQLWWSSGTPGNRDLELVDDAQARPERPASSAATGTLWLDYLDRRLSQLGPGALPSLLIAASSGRTAPTAPRWDNEPDTYDVLRHTLDQSPTRFAALLADFAVNRAFLGARDDGRHWPDLGWAGRFGNVRWDWLVPYSTLPRRVLASPPVAPSGSLFVWLALDQNPGQAPLGFQAEWEPPVSFVWTLVKLGKNGAELGRVQLPYQQRATSVEQQLNELGDAAAVLAVGTNVGGVDLAHPFDPDLAPFEPAGCTVYLTKL